MRIGIDARFYGKEGKGIGRYTAKLIKYLEEVDQKNDYFIFLRRNNFDLYKPRHSNFKKVLADISWYSFKEQIVFPFILKKYHLDLVHFLHFNVPLIWRRKFIVTIHDLIHSHTGQQGSTRSAGIYFFKKIAYQLVIKHALRNSSKIIAVSFATKEEIKIQFNIEDSKIQVIYEGVEEIAEKEKPIEEVKKPFLLYIGNAYPHKNLGRLIEAFKLIREKERKISLVLVGKIDYFYQNWQKIAFEQKIKDIVFLGQREDEEIKWLYKNSLAYICPSWEEGFGLPGLEAMFYGTPVICSKTSSLPEIYGQAAFYFDPGNVQEIAESILKVWENQDERKSLIEKGKEQVKRYSWLNCAQNTQKIYQEFN